MSNWINLNLFFKNYPEIVSKLHNDSGFNTKPSGVYKELIHYLKTVVESLSGLINRYFFLFEDNPHLFLSLELNDIGNIDLVKQKSIRLKNPISLIQQILIQIAIKKKKTKLLLIFLM